MVMLATLVDTPKQSPPDRGRWFGHVKFSDGRKFSYMYDEEHDVLRWSVYRSFHSRYVAGRENPVWVGDHFLYRRAGHQRKRAFRVAWALEKMKNLGTKSDLD